MLSGTDIEPAEVGFVKVPQTNSLLAIRDQGMLRCDRTKTQLDKATALRNAMLATKQTQMNADEIYFSDRIQLG
ncbi:MAG: hypothetical protein DSM106950_05520 [Stigonema ocellatum SAG 48.90 = DSM 106950]|nr:hypothetical protein [Stigonema ocellatum SAG 48.90 = DSM 106950]